MLLFLWGNNELFRQSIVCFHEKQYSIGFFQSMNIDFFPGVCPSRYSGIVGRDPGWPGDDIHAHDPPGDRIHAGHHQTGSNPLRGVRG